MSFAGYSGQAYSPAGDKGRFVLPPLFRKAVKESSEGRVLCLAKHERWNCLTGFGLSRKSELEDQLEREEDRAIRLDKDFDRDLRAMQLFGFVGSVAGTGGVAYSAHIGGFVIGLVLTLPLFIKLGGTRFWKTHDYHPPHAPTFR